MPQEGNPLGRTIDEANFVSVHRCWIGHGRNLHGEGGEFHEPSLVVAKIGRRDAKVLSEGPRERLVGAITGIKRHADNGTVGAAQPQGGSLQPQPAHLFPDGLADHCPKHPMKMIGREVSQPRQLLQDQLLVEMILDVKLHPQNAVPVSLLCSWYAHDA